MTKLCKICREPNPNSMRQVCSFAHAMEYLKLPEVEAKKQKALAKIIRRKEKKAKVKAKGLNHWLKETQKVFNEWVRLDDIDKSCISCGMPDHMLGDVFGRGKWDAGHFKPVGSNREIRFHRWNINKQCINCNSFKSSNREGYQAAILAVWGQERLDWLNGPHEIQRYTIEYLARFRRVYRKRIRIRKKLRGII